MRTRPERAPPPTVPLVTTRRLEPALAVLAVAPPEETERVRFSRRTLTDVEAVCPTES